MKKRTNNFGLALIGGIAVFASGMAVNLALISHDPVITVHMVIANTITALIAIVIALALQLRHAEQHYRFATERAASMAEINHNVRNAVFPLFLAVQRYPDPEVNRLANEAMARLNIALRDAAVDAYSGKINYADESSGHAAAA